MEDHSSKNVVLGDFSNVGKVRIGDEIHIHPEKIKLPKVLTPRVPTISFDRVIGRHNELDDLHQRLFDNKQVVLVNGLAGIGKTTLAQAYIGKYWEEYDHLAWISQVSNNILSDFVNTERLLDNLEIGIEGKDHRALFFEILAKLQSIDETRGLLIIDNADTSLSQWKDYLPHQPLWHVLVTSRQRIEKFNPKELDFLSEDDAVKLFLTHYTRGKIGTEEIRELLATVDLHTLTIEILAKTAQLQRTPLTELKNAIENDLRANVYVAHKGNKIERVTSYLSSIFTLGKSTADELWALKHFACLPPEFHSYELLQDLMAPEANQKEEVIPETLENLVTKGWLLQNSETDSYKLHRIIADVVKKQQPITLSGVKSLIHRIAQKLSIDQTRDNPVEKFPWIPYGKTVLAVFPASDDKAISRLQNNLALVLKDLGDYEGAKELLEKATRSAEKNFGAEHPTTAVRYSNLALVLKALGDYEGALKLSEKSVDIFKACLPQGHPYIETVSNICDSIKKQIA